MDQLNQRSEYITVRNPGGVILMLCLPMLLMAGCIEDVMNTYNDPRIRQLEIHLQYHHAINKECDFDKPNTMRGN